MKQTFYYMNTYNNNCGVLADSRIILTEINRNTSILHFTVLCMYIHIYGFCFLGFFLQIEGLWQPCIEHVYQHHFSNSICSLHVTGSYFGNS